MSKKNGRLFGFTIVELLVVVVVIGVLAAVVTVSFNGISRRATEVSVQSDLSNVAKQLKMSQAEFDRFPSTINCTQSDSSTNKCLKSSGGNNFGDFQVSNKSSGQSFCVEIYNGSVNYFITESTPPTSGNCPVLLKISTSYNHTCAIGSDNNAYCWGDNAQGQVGDASNGNNKLLPTAVSRTGALTGLTIKSISSGYNHTCAIASDDNAYCWGNNQYGQLGNNTSGGISSSPVAVHRTGALSGLTVKSIYAGGSHTCIIASNDNIYCWGYNQYGQLGDNNIGVNKSAPTLIDKTGVMAGLTIKYLSVSGHNTCAVASDNNAYCWGENTYGQIGNNTSGSSYGYPVAVTRNGALNGLSVRSVYTGENHTCIIASDSNAYCWGFNGDGELGTGSSGANQLNPIAVNRSGALSGLTARSISVGGVHTCLIASDNNAYCWGQNGWGQLGIGSSGVNQLSPIAVSKSGALSGLTLKYITTGLGHTCVVASNDSSYCWGFNNNGQLGNNASGTNILSPGAVLSLP